MDKQFRTKTGGKAFWPRIDFGVLLSSAEDNPEKRRAMQGWLRPARKRDIGSSSRRVIKLVEAGEQQRCIQLSALMPDRNLIPRR